MYTAYLILLDPLHAYNRLLNVPRQPDKEEEVQLADDGVGEGQAHRARLYGVPGQDGHQGHRYDHRHANHLEPQVQPAVRDDLWVASRLQRVNVGLVFSLKGRLEAE